MVNDLPFPLKVISPAQKYHDAHQYKSSDDRYGYTPGPEDDVDDAKKEQHQYNGEYLGNPEIQEFPPRAGPVYPVSCQHGEQREDDIGVMGKLEA